MTCGLEFETRTHDSQIPAVCSLLFARLHSGTHDSQTTGVKSPLILGSPRQELDQLAAWMDTGLLFQTRKARVGTIGTTPRVLLLVSCVRGGPLGCRLFARAAPFSRSSENVRKTVEAQRLEATLSVLLFSIISQS